MNFKEKQKEFAANLTRYREKAGYNAKDFSRLVGISYTTYYGYEKAIAAPKYDVLCRIADLLNVSLDDLLGRRNVQLQKAADFLETSGVKVEMLDYEVDEDTGEVIDSDECNIGLSMGDDRPKGRHKGWHVVGGSYKMIFHSKSEIIAFADDIRKEYQKQTAPVLYKLISEKTDDILWTGYGDSIGYKQRIDKIGRSRPAGMKDDEFIAKVVYMFVSDNKGGPLLLLGVQYAKETYCNGGTNAPLAADTITTLRKAAEEKERQKWDQISQRLKNKDGNGEKN